MRKMVSLYPRYRNSLKSLEEVWEFDLSQLSRLRRFFYRQIRLGYIVAHGMRADLVKLHAAALSFRMLLAIAPLLAVTFSVLKAFGVHNRLEPALEKYLAPFGPHGGEVTRHLVQFVDNIHAGALGIVGLATLFMTVLGLMGDIEQAFNRIWRVEKPRRFARKFSDYLSVLLVGPVLVFSALGITATLQSADVVRWLVGIEPFGTIILAALKLIPYLTIWGALSFLYVFIPNTQVKIRSALLGGFVAGILWQTLGLGFAVFVAASTQYYTIYSSFAILLLFFLWIYLGWGIALFGAEVAYAHQHLEDYRKEKGIEIFSSALSEMTGLKIMTLVGQNFSFGKEPWSREELGKRLHLSDRLIGGLLRILIQNQLLIETSKGETYVPARDLEKITVKQILDAIRHHGGSAPAAPEGEEDRRIVEIFRDIDHSILTAVEGKSLKQLVLAPEPPPPG
ncbi:MAG: YihY/virulence factor BrkB family protein [Deltaproteobacteria bacterium]|nr:YihY/virulence factor BrkB family protein [Deltaproteobacteria bacterium]